MEVNFLKTVMEMELVEENVNFVKKGYGGDFFKDGYGGEFFKGSHGDEFFKGGSGGEFFKRSYGEIMEVNFLKTVMEMELIEENVNFVKEGYGGELG